MRYRVDKDPGMAALNSPDHTLILTVLMSLFIGIVLTWLGYSGSQWWLTI